MSRTSDGDMRSLCAAPGTEFGAVGTDAAFVEALGLLIMAAITDAGILSLDRSINP
jgi:hypothetical protein